MSFPPRFLDEIRARVGLSERIGRSVRLIRRGREHVGLCPFHNEKTPSFTVNDDKGFFHCFGCGAHGDVIAFAMQNDGLAFPEAVERLAGEAGLAMPERTPEARAEARRLDGIQEVLEFAAGWFARVLARTEEPDGARWFAARGLSAETISRFRLGYAPASGRALALVLEGEGVPVETACDAGLLRRPDDGRPYDFFRGRVVFPIGDGAGRAVGFGARSLGGAGPKYINSPESPLFRKRRTLYNLAGARRPAREAGTVVVCEGYMDVIALAQAGIAHAVAPLGTAVTEDHLAALWRLAAEPVLCLDGDRAGRAAARRAAERALPLLAPGRSLAFAFLPDGEDPDSLVARAGAGALRERLDAAVPLVEVAWRGVAAGKRADTPERRAGLLREIDKRIAEIADPRVRAAYGAAFRARFDAAFRAPRRRDSRRRNAWAARGFEELAAPPGDSERLERLMLVAMLNHPGLLPEFAEELAEIEFEAPGLRNLRALLVDFAAAPEPTAAALRERLAAAGALDYAQRLVAPGSWESGRIAESFARPEADADAARAGFRHLAGRRRRAALEADLRAAEAELGERMDGEALAVLVQLRRQLHALDNADARPPAYPGASAGAGLVSRGCGIT